MFLKASFLLALTFFPVFSAFAGGKCGPLTSGEAFDHGVLTSQVDIDQDRVGLARFKRKGKTRLIEVERLWGLGSKEIYREKPDARRVRGFELSFNLRSSSVHGVGIWRLGIKHGHEIIENFMTDENRVRLFLDGEEISVAALEQFVVERKEGMQWRKLTAIFKEPVALAEDAFVDLYARTLHNEPWAITNLATGTRVDACAYFILE